ncbi:MAG: aquaporin [Phycisphaerales bacterium]|nr:aquaporin [Phycisphaerales bacterium]
MLHPTEAIIEGVLLGTFMFIACSVVVVFCHPESPVARTITKPLTRRFCIGILMGLTAIALIYSPLGQRSGAHMNPVPTLVFTLLGKVSWPDAIAYPAGQFLGGFLGVALARALVGPRVGHESVSYASTVPGAHGTVVAFLGELVIATLLMSMVLWMSNTAFAVPFTGIVAGCMVASFITLEAPLSGMSMNPARTLSSALWSRRFRGLWIYFTAPPLGMLLAAIGYVGIRGIDAVYCAKLQHPQDGPCLFHCNIDRMPGRLPAR